MDNTCKQNLSREQILSEFGKDDLDGCKGCPNLKYKDGIMTCELIKENAK